MKAAIYEGPNDLKVKEVDKPICTEETMVVRVKVCAICGTDLKTLKDQDVKMDRKKLAHEFVDTRWENELSSPPLSPVANAITVGEGIMRCVMNSKL